jgi:hypothetical protein
MPTRVRPELGWPFAAPQPPARRSNSDWLTQQARNLSWKLDEAGIRLSLVIHDRDREA